MIKNEYNFERTCRKLEEAIERKELAAKERHFSFSNITLAKVVTFLETIFLFRASLSGKQKPPSKKEGVLTSLIKIAMGSFLVGMFLKFRLNDLIRRKL